MRKCSTLEFYFGKRVKNIPYYEANEFFTVRTNREGVLTKRAHNSAVLFLTFSAKWFSTFFMNKRNFNFQQISLRFLAFLSRETLIWNSCKFSAILDHCELCLIVGAGVFLTEWIEFCLMQMLHQTVYIHTCCALLVNFSKFFSPAKRVLVKVCNRPFCFAVITNFKVKSPKDDS